MNINFNHINDAIDQWETYREVAIYLRGAEYMGCYTLLDDSSLEILSDYARIAQYETLKEHYSFDVSNQLRV